MAKSTGLGSRLTAAALALLVVGCGRGRETAPALGGAAARARSEPIGRPTGGRPRIVILGDSLAAGLGLAQAQAFPGVLQEHVHAAGLDFDVVNAGVSGDTSAGGLGRLGWVLDGPVRILVVALGGNDGLRGLPVDELRGNLSAIIEQAQVRGVTVILAGMEAPPNFGHEYTASFRQVYSDLATRYGVALVPFLLDGVAGVSSMNQRDGIHPTSAGARRVAENVWTVLRPIAAAEAARRPGRPLPTP